MRRKFLTIYDVHASHVPASTLVSSQQTSVSLFLERWPICVGKRVMDVLASCICIVLFSPIMISLSIYIFARYGTSPIFRHKRVGKDGKMFSCYKFRTMVPDADKVLADLLKSDPALFREWEETNKLRNDPRIFPGIGAKLRKYSLDELPQFFNVLFGQMSVVGPRPVTADELPMYGDRIERYMATKPGITGAWQIGGRSETTLEERVALDVWYAENMSLRLDCQIFFKTVFSFVSGRLSGGV